MLLLKTLVVLAVLWLVAVALRHLRDRSPGPYVEPRFESPIDKPRCRVCAGAGRGAGERPDRGAADAAAGPDAELPRAGDAPAGKEEASASRQAAPTERGVPIAAQAAAALGANPPSAASRARLGRSADADDDASGPAATVAASGSAGRTTEAAGGSAGALAAPGPTETSRPPPPPPSNGRDGTLSVAPDRRDDLKRIKGIGKVMEGKLNALGITTFAQLAGFRQEDIDRVDATLESFKGRIERDRWVEQAAALAREEEEEEERT